MKKRVLMFLLVCVMMFALAGCGKKITEGEVYYKEFKLECTIISTVPIVHSNGKSCYTTYIPMVFHYPDRWCIKIRSLNKDENGKYEKATYYTTKEVYDSCEVGDMFEYDENRDFDEEPVTKEKEE